MGDVCPFLLLPALVTGPGWAGLSFPFSWIDGMEGCMRVSFTLVRW